MRLLKTTLLVPLAATIVGVLFWFRPGGVDGPQPAPVAAEGKGFDHSALTTVLAAAVQPDGTVDYAALQSDRGPLDRYLGQLRATSPKSAPHRFKTTEDRLAYYINAYNAFVLAAVRDHCPIADVNAEYIGGGFFWRIAFLMGEEPVTLSQIEGEFIRGVGGREPAVHFALVKGAKGFPALERAAYEGATVKARLGALSARVATDPRFARQEGTTTHLSTLFQWYQADFAGDPVGWLKQHGAPLGDGEGTIEYTPFDWSLNGGC